MAETKLSKGKWRIYGNDGKLLKNANGDYVDGGGYLKEDKAKAVHHVGAINNNQRINGG